MGRGAADHVPFISSSQIFMKYGRQRWKLKGKIEVNGKQSWDKEKGRDQCVKAPIYYSGKLIDSIFKSLLNLINQEIYVYMCYIQTWA